MAVIVKNVGVKAFMSLDITGMRVGALTAIEPTGERKNGYTIWRCRCDCGKEVFVDLRKFKRETARDCGCGLGGKREAPQDLTGLRFGKLTVLERTNMATAQGRLWRCRCDCGNLVDLPAPLLRGGFRRSCGCVNRAKVSDFVGKRFGMLTVVEYDGKWNGIHTWNCRCDCGRLVDVSQTDLQNGTATTCGWHPNLREEDSARNPDEKAAKITASGVRGVYSGKGRDRYVAQITFQRKSYYLGSYDNLDEAAQVRKEAEKQIEDDGFLSWYQERRQKS